VSRPATGTELARRFWFGAARKAYVAFKEGRLAYSPAAWFRLLRLHYEELKAPGPVVAPSKTGRVAARDARSAATAEAPQVSADTRTRLDFADLDRIVLDQWLESGGRLRFPAGQPLVTVLIVLYNRAELTLRCLRAITAVTVPLELVVVDNASSDNTSRLLDRLDGVTVIRNVRNEGFVEAVNQGARLAQGDLLLLLNSDAEVLPGSLEAAVETLLSVDSIGAVVGKLVHMDGRLQEAGSIVWRDGSCQGYGRGDDPLAAPYMFRRPVDFGSGAFLLTRRHLFLEQGGFDERFRPAYYEDADYCLRLWQSGRQVVYEPRAVVMHVEFASSANREAAVEMQIERRSRFVAKHGTWLRSHAWQPQGRLLAARTHTTGGRRLLFVEDRVPHEKLGAGYPRSRAMLQAALDLGHHVTLYPVLEPDESWDEAYSDVPREVELMLGYGAAGLAGFLKDRLSSYDAMIVSRPHNMSDVSRVLQSISLAEPPWFVYDAEALFCLREIGRRRLAGAPVSTKEAGRMLAEELSLAEGCDVIVAVSDAEAKHFSDAGFLHVETLGNSLVPRPTPHGFIERSGFLFVGAFVDDIAPNTDAVLWFVRDILPRIQSKIGPVHLTVAGRGRPGRIAALSNSSVTWLGAVDDLCPLYESARVFVAPTRFGAGIPIKVHHAAAFGVPVVCTSLVAGQLSWYDEQDVLVADDPEGFAEQCCRLYKDEQLWIRLRESARQRVEHDCSPDTFRRVFARSLDGARSTTRYETTSGVGPYSDAGSIHGLVNGSR
jgi:GT2 family glycosyltransferase